MKKNHMAFVAVMMILAAMTLMGPVPAAVANPVLPLDAGHAPVPADVSSTAASLSPQYGGTLRIISPDAPSTLGVFQAGPNDLIHQQPGIEAFLDASASRAGNGFEPVLCESVEDDVANSRIVFHLRPGIKFHDGAPLTADVAVWNYQRMIENGRMPYYSYFVGIDQTDNYTFQIRYNGYNNQLLYTWGNVYPRSRAAFEAGTGGSDDPEVQNAWDSTHIVGTGPFMLQEYIRDSHMYWVKNPEYWRTNQPYLDGIDIRFIADPVTARAIMETGQADYWTGASATDINELENNGLVEVSSWPGLVYSLWPNTVASDQPFSDNLVRQAIEYVIDKDAIATALGGDEFHSLGQLSPPAEWGYDPAYAKRMFNPGYASQLLADAGYPNGFATTLLVNASSPLEVALATYIQQYLATVDVIVELDLADPGRYFGTVFGDTVVPGMALVRSLTETNGLITYMRWFGTDAPIDVSYLGHTPEQNYLDDQAILVTDAAGQQAVTLDLYRYMNDNALVIPLFLAPFASIAAPYVHSRQYQTGLIRWQHEETWLGTTGVWKRETTMPTHIPGGVYTQYPGSDIADFAVSQDGTVVYAAVKMPGAADVLLKSSNGGASWTDLTLNIPTGYNYSFDSFDFMAISPDNADIVVLLDTGGADGDVRIIASTDGGRNFYDMGTITDSTGDPAAAVYEVDVSAAMPNNIYCVAVAGASTAGQSDDPAVYYYNFGASVGVWREAVHDFGTQAVIPVGEPPPWLPGTEIDSFRAVKFTADGFIVALSEQVGTATENSTLRLHILSPVSHRWDTDLALTGYPVTVDSVAAPFQVNAAAVAIGPDFVGNEQYTHIAFIGASIDSVAEAGGLYRVDEKSAVKEIRSNLGIYSVDYDGFTVVAGAYIDNNVYRVIDPLGVAPLAAAARSLKRIGVDDTGVDDRVVVQFAGGQLFGAKRGDASAFSRSIDLGNTWNDFSLMDSRNTVIDDVIFLPDGTWYMSASDWDGTEGEASVYRMSSAFPPGAGPQRVLCVSQTAAGQPNLLLRGIPGDPYVLYAFDQGGPDIYQTADGGLGRWSKKTTFPGGSIGDLAVESGSVLYGAAGQFVYKSTSSGSNWWSGVNTNLSGGVFHLVCLTFGNLVAGGQQGGVAFSTDGGENWTLAAGSATPESALPVYVAATRLSPIGLTPNDYIFAAPVGSNTVFRTMAFPLAGFETMNFPGYFDDAGAETGATTMGMALLNGMLYVLGTNRAAPGNIHLWRAPAPASPWAHTANLWGEQYYTAGIGYAHVPHLEAVAINGGIRLYSIFNWLDISGTYPPGVFYLEDQLPDMSPPVVNSFGADRTDIFLGANIRFNYSVADSGGSGFKQIDLRELIDADDDNQPVPPYMIRIVATQGLTGDSASGYFDYAPPTAGVRWYSVCVVDKKGNVNDETNFATGGLPGVFGPLRVTVTVPSSGGGGGGGGGSPGLTLLRDAMTSEGKMTVNTTASSADRLVRLSIEKDTIALNRAGQPLASIRITPMADPPPPPEDAHVIGLAYDFQPGGSMFDPGATLTFHYDPDDLPAGFNEAGLSIAFYDTSKGEWTVLENIVVDLGAHTISGDLRHFTALALIAYPPAAPAPTTTTPTTTTTTTTPLTKTTATTTPAPAPSPASFSVSDLSVIPNQVIPGETANVVATVINTGGSRGSYNIVLNVNGIKGGQRELSLESGEREVVSFTLTLADEGDYYIDIAGDIVQLTVKAPETTEAQGRVAGLPFEQPNNWGPLAGGVAVAMIIAGTLVYIFVLRRRRA